MPPMAFSGYLSAVLRCITLLFVTTLFAYIWQISRVVATSRQELYLLMTDLKAALTFTTKVLAIGFNSLAYGLGIIL